ncbi:MAG: hypothetical protein N2C12_11320, partial [Planctomycetales bacterium]
YWERNLRARKKGSGSDDRPAWQRDRAPWEKEAATSKSTPDGGTQLTRYGDGKGGWLPADYWERNTRNRNKKSGDKEENSNWVPDRAPWDR